MNLSCIYHWRRYDDCITLRFASPYLPGMGLIPSRGGSHRHDYGALPHTIFTSERQR